jgi:hypothetical protein
MRSWNFSALIWIHWPKPAAQPEDGAQQRAVARPAGPGDGHPLARLHPQVDAVNGWTPAIPAAHRAQPQGQAARQSPLTCEERRIRARNGTRRARHVEKD